MIKWLKQGKLEFTLIDVLIAVAIIGIVVGYISTVCIYYYGSRNF